MDANTWALIALVVLMAACCMPMLFMRRRHGGHPRDESDDKGNKPGA